MTDCRTLYLDLLKHALIGLIYEDPPLFSAPVQGVPTTGFLRKFREYGLDLPSQAFSGIGLRRMNNLQRCVEQILADGVPGDLIETGVWRGGAVIFMRGVLKAYGVSDRTVWVADSFQGLPQPDLTQYPMDEMWTHRMFDSLRTTRADVEANFAHFDLWDAQVQILEGWFVETLPAAPITRLALMRLDGDLYESTRDALAALYPKLAPGGFVIIDDYRFEGCRQAVHDYRDAQGITEPIVDIDRSGAYWRRASAA